MKLIGLLLALVVVTSGCLVTPGHIRECRELEENLIEDGQSCSCKATTKYPSNTPDSQKDVVDNRGCSCECEREDGTTTKLFITKPKQN